MRCCVGRVRLAFVVAVISLVACGDDDSSVPDATVLEDAGIPEQQSFRVLTWNVENLFDSVDDPDTFDDVPSATAVRAKLSNIADVLRLVDADFVALQEVENEAILAEVAAQVPELGYDNLGLMDAFDGRGIDVAYLSRVPLAGPPNVISHIGERFPLPDGSGNQTFFTRDALEVYVDVAGVPIGLLIVHYRSMRDGGELVREAEAAYTRQIVEGRIGDGREHLLVVGDLNDNPDSATLAALLEGDTLDDMTTRVPADDRWSFVFDRIRRQFDYILATGPMIDFAVDIDFVHGDIVDEASDHQPVTAEFLIRP